ncbi:MAG: cytochrome C [Ignavibacterium album]|uniref:cytochrome c3 family protein n=1 Tax=Ignavibacterium album TaxID=591197 RepID=UPI0026F28C99|nr:cytochrome c3 family protein [Ignavibacterium album]MBI5663134.1 cytochrome C [Ignavibacterium album]
MKKLCLWAAFILFAASQIVWSQAGITGSAHDFSGQGWGTTEICQPCHTPHNADASLTDAPLWNHQTTTTTFTLYSSSTLTTTTIGQPDGSSKLCLSCHDGTVALENFGGTTTGTHFISGEHNLGVTLANDHPISFIYNTALATADGGLFDPATHTTSLGGTINNDLLIGGKLQCASCHDVHNHYNNPSLLKISNNGSMLCLTCHNK